MVGTARGTSTSDRGGLLALVLLGVAVAAFVAAGLTLLSGARPIESLGLPDPGALTTYGLPVVSTLTEVSAVLALGALLLVGFLAPPSELGYLDVSGYRTLRSASYAAAAWAVGALLMVPLTVADSLGRPVTDVLGFAQLVGLVPKLDTARAWALTALLAVLLFAGCRVVLSWGGSVLLGALAVVGLLPVAATGHSSAGGAHDVATDSLMVHVVAAALWVGGLVALLGLAGWRASASRLPTAVRRFSALALVCWLVMAVSGVLNALVRIALPDLLGSYYGALLLAKTGCLLVLGGLGYLQRRHAVGAVGRGRRGALLRLGAVEVLVMLGTLGLAVALSRAAPPVRGVSTPSRTAVEIGYDLAGPPTLSRLAFDWRFSLLFGTAVLVAAIGYLVWVRRVRARSWPPLRTVSWLAGCLVVLLATSSGVGRYAPAVAGILLVQHALLGVLAPMLLVLGAPLTLALRALPERTSAPRVRPGDARSGEVSLGARPGEVSSGDPQSPGVRSEGMPPSEARSGETQAQELRPAELRYREVRASLGVARPAQVRDRAVQMSLDGSASSVAGRASAGRSDGSAAAGRSDGSAVPGSSERSALTAGVVGGMTEPVAWEKAELVESEAPGARQLLLAAGESGLVRGLTRPLVALVAVVAPGWVLYLTGFFDSLVISHPWQLTVQLYLLASGLVFGWLVFGGELLPRRVQLGARVGVLVVALGWQVVLAVMVGGGQVLGQAFYTGLGLPWPLDLAGDQRVGATWSGAIAAVVLLAALALVLTRRPRPRPDQPLPTPRTP